MDDDEGLLLFEPGAMVVIDTESRGKLAGGFIGLTDFGIAFKLTHREGFVDNAISDDHRKLIAEEFAEMSLKELQEIAREESLKVAGRKAELVERITEAAVKTINTEMPQRPVTIELSVPTTTLLSWSEIQMIQDGEDYMNNIEVMEFKSTIVDSLDMLDEDAAVPSGHSGSSDE